GREELVLRQLPVSLAALALTLPAIIVATVQAPLPVRADISSPPSSSSSSSLPTNWVQQYHQNGGGSVSGHVVGWGDQNYDLVADHFGVQSQDASVSTTATLGGTNTVSDQIGFQIGASHSYMTVATGDTSTTITNKLASLLNGGALTATVGGTLTGYTNGDKVTLTG